MKKIVAIFLLLAIMTIFVSCGDKDKDENQTPLNTGVNSSDVETTTEGTTEVEGIVLTTDPAKMAQWGYVTEFIPTEYTQPTYATVSVPTLIDSSERPTPQISQVTINPDSTTTNNGTTSNGIDSTNVAGPTVSEITTPTDDDPVSENQKTPKPISVSSSSISNDRKGEFLETATLDVSSSGWDGSIIANSGNATVIYAGNEYKAPCSVSASLNSQGCYEIVISLSGLEIPAGTEGITVSLPEGFIRNSADTQYSMSFSRRM